LLLEAFALAHKVRLAAVYPHFGGAVAGVVIAGHAGGIGAGAADGQNIAGFTGERAVVGEKIAGFANRADHIGADGRNVFWLDGFDMVISLIKSGAHQIVHRGIYNDEVFFFAVFDVFHFGEQRAGVAHQAAAGLEHQFERPRADERGYGSGIAG